MDSYNKTNVKIAGVIAGLSVLFGLLGYQLIHKDFFMNITAIVMGLDLILFSHDLTMQRVVRYKLNYKFYRGMYIFVGIVFIVASIITLVNRH